MRKLLIASLAVPTAVLCTLAAACSSSSSGGGTEPTSTATDAGAGVDTGPTATATSTADASADLINGCTSLTDNTAAGVAAPGLNWGFSIGADGNHCSKIKVGQSVTWTGDFTTHPLVAHDSSGAADASASPITNGSTTGQGSVTITFPTAGTYGYWCQVHTTAMMGAIVVE